jgi:hypothetical protein
MDNAYKICYVNFDTCSNVHNSLELAQLALEYHEALSP